MGAWIREGLESLVTNPVDVYALGYYGAGCPVCGAGLHLETLRGCEHLLAVRFMEDSWRWLGDLEQRGDFDVGFPMDEVEDDGEESDPGEGDDREDFDEDDDRDEGDDIDEGDEYEARWAGLLTQLQDVLAHPKTGPSRGPATLKSDWVAVCVFWSEEPHPFAACTPTLVAWPLSDLPPLTEGPETVGAAILARNARVGEAFAREMGKLEAASTPAEFEFDPYTASARLSLTGVGPLIPPDSSPSARNPGS